MRQNKFSSQIIALKNCQMAEHWGLVVMLTCYMNNSLGQNYGCESVFKLRICLGEKCRNMNSFLFVMTYFKPKAWIIIFSKNQPMLEINQPSTSNKAMTEILQISSVEESMGLKRHPYSYCSLPHSVALRKCSVKTIAWLAGKAPDISGLTDAVLNTWG